MHRLRCFGRLVIEDEQGERVQLRSRKHLALLLYLAAHRDRRHDRERVARLFWDTEVSLARHSLSQALYDLRQHVPDLELDRTNREVGLGPNGLTYEGRDLEDAVREDRLGRAVRIYDGPFAPDLETVGGPDFERWVERERTRFRSLAEKALLRRVSECADDGRWGEMVVAGNRLVDMNPLNEEAHRAVIRGLWLQGDRGAALAHFDENEEFLLRELPGGLAPETRELVQKIRSSDRSKEAPSVRERPRPEMVGREKEFRVLRDALADVMEGQSRFIVVRGEAGIGKTRLLEEFAEVAALEDVRLLKSRCYAAESDVPYGPIVDGLKDLAREVADAADEEDQSYYQLGHLFPEAFGEPEREEWDSVGKGTAQRRLAEELRQMLAKRAEDDTIVWLIEDLHWADATSHWVLRYISRRLEKASIQVVVTTRNRVSQLTVEDSPTGLWHELYLSSLTSDQIKRLISMVDTECTHDLSDVASLADGNPFYALELTKSARIIESTDPSDNHTFKEDLPAAISNALRVEFEKASVEERQILAIVAVAEAHAHLNLIISIADLSSAELIEVATQLRDRAILRTTEGRLSYRHDIVRRFIYHSLDSLSKTALHLEVAEWLAESEKDIDKGTLAFHHYQANAIDSAYRLAVDAARKAIQRYANQEAINLSRLALKCAQSEAKVSEARCVLGEAQYRNGNVADALKTLDSLQENHNWVSVLGNRSMHLLKADAAVELTQWGRLKSAVKALNESENVKRRDYLWGKYLLMKAAIRTNDRRVAAKTLEEVKSASVSSEDLECETLVWMTKAAYEAFYGSIDKCDRYIAFVQRYADELPHSLQYTVRHLAGLTAQRLGKQDVALRQGKITYNLALKYQDTVPALVSLNNMFACYLEIGAWNDAREALERIEGMAPDDKEKSSNIALLLATNKASLLFVTEELGRLESYCKTILRNGPSVDAGYIQPELLAIYGLNALALGKIKEAQTVWTKITDEYSKGDVVRPGVQNGYKFYWLQATLKWHQGDCTCVAQLREQAEYEDTMDKLGAARMRWLAKLLEISLQSEGSRQLEHIRVNDIEEFDELKGYNMGWFGYFSRRWLHRVYLQTGPNSGA